MPEISPLLSSYIYFNKTWTRGYATQRSMMSSQIVNSRQVCRMGSQHWYPMPHQARQEHFDASTHMIFRMTAGCTSSPALTLIWLDT